MRMDAASAEKSMPSPPTQCNIVLDIEGDEEASAAAPSSSSSSSSSGRDSTTSDPPHPPHPLRTWLNGATSRWPSFSRSTSTQSECPRDPPPVYDIFLGGSCGNTVWRRELVIPYLKKRSITYYDPQRPVWNENMIQEEQVAKENSKLFLFVLDPGTINATSFIEIAYFAAKKAPKLVVVFLGRREWSDKAHPMDLPDRIRTVNLVEAILKRHSVPMLTSINEALDYVDEMIIGEKSWRQAITNPLQRLPYAKVKARRALHSATSSIKHAFSTIGSSAGAWSRKFGVVLALELTLVLFIHFYLLIPFWILILPVVALDYVALAGFILYLKLMLNRNRNKYNRKLILNPPSIPRTATASITTSSDASSVASMDGGELTQLKTVQPTSLPDYHTANGQLNNTSNSGEPPCFYDSIQMVENQVRQHYQHEKPRPKTRTKKLTRQERLQTNGCISSPVGYDVFLSCSSGSELEWITQKAVPQLHKSGLTYTSAIMCDKEMRIPMLHTASHILYYIPSYKTFLSGMIEIAYFIGHSDWQVTVCVPSEAECLVLMDAHRNADEETLRAVERRNECYQMAFCYLKDMARRRKCQVFTKIEDAIKHISKLNQFQFTNDKKASLRNLVEKQHLMVRERTQANLLAHRSAVIAAATASASPIKHQLGKP